jgi:hypothetical protein
MKKLLMTMVIAVGTAAMMSAQAPASDTEKAQMKAYMDMLRKDIRAGKNAIVDQAMGLEAADKAKFWAVYEKYEAEQKSLWDKRFANIKKYAENYNNLTDEVADQLASTSMDNDAQAMALRKKYYPQMKAAIGSRGAARFLQVEVMLGHLIGLQLGDEIPLIP